jgi:uncharacterized protein with von Willebrand factor type A (vWA) domain
MSDSLVIKPTQWESIQKDDFQKESPSFQKAIQVGEEKNLDFQNFSQDIFSSLYRFNDNPPMGKGPEWAQKALEELRALPDFKALRQSTRANSFNSGLASILFTQKLAETLQENQENQENLSEEQKEEHASAVRSALRKACEQATEETEQAEALLASWGSEQENIDKATAKDKLELFNKIKNNRKLSEISKLAGRFKAEMDRVRSNKKNAGPDEITSIETGSDLNRILASELCKLNNRKAKLLLFKDYIEGSLMQYRFEENIKESRGPIVFALDCSGSMTGDPEVWAKAIMVSIATLAAKENRPFKVILFNSSIQLTEEFTDPNQKQDKLFSICDYYCAGGTNFDLPLLTAMELIKKENKWEKADIIFITDGLCSIDKNTTSEINKMKESGMKLLTILIGLDDSDSEIEKLSTTTYKVKDLYKEDSDAKEAVFSI